jgi:hypothetical protein
VPFEDLLSGAHARVHPLAAGGPSQQERAALGMDLLNGVANRFLELHAGPSRFARLAGERPMVSPLARWQAQAGRPLTNLRHILVQPGDGLQALVPLLDGTRDRPALLASGALKLDAEGLDAALEELAQAALLMAV